MICARKADEQLIRKWEEIWPTGSESTAATSLIGKSVEEQLATTITKRLHLKDLCVLKTSSNVFVCLNSNAKHTFTRTNKTFLKMCGLNYIMINIICMWLKKYACMNENIFIVDLLKS